MFGTYNVISLVVLLNMLIAMMNNSYQLIAVSSFALHSGYLYKGGFRRGHLAMEPIGISMKQPVCFNYFTLAFPVVRLNISFQGNSVWILQSLSPGNVEKGVLL